MKPPRTKVVYLILTNNTNTHMMLKMPGLIRQELLESGKTLIRVFVSLRLYTKEAFKEK